MVKGNKNPDSKKADKKVHAFWKRKKKEEKPLSPGAQKAVDFLNRFAVFFHFAACFIGYFAIEWMSRHSFGEAWAFLDERTKVFLYNTFLIFVTTLPVFLFRHRAFFRVLIGAIWLIAGAANGIILANRVTPLTGPDLGMMSEGKAVLSKYMNAGERMVMYVAIVVLIVLIVILFFAAPKYKGKRRWFLILPGIIAGFVGLWGATRLLLEMKQLSAYFANIAFAYEDYGFPYSFLVTLFDTGIDEPDNYSAELIEGIVREEGEIKETDMENLPNIVVVQLESFFDPTRVEWLNISEDPIPNWRELAKQYSTGLYEVPTVGAGTVNTEFETLTGMSLRFFGAGEYPYKGILLEGTCESAAYDLAEIGYSTHALHNNEANFYSRRRVYANLGFESFTSEEYMDTQYDVNENDWMRDENLIPYIGDALDYSDNQDFVFVVSVQPHGAYPTEPVIDDPVIKVSGAATDGENCAWEYYVNQVYEEDQFVADLISYLDERGEPTIVLFYGDHLPTMGLVESDLTYGSTFQTDYLIWDNLGLKKKDKNFTSYQAMARIMSLVNIHEGKMFTFQQTMQKKESYMYDMQTLQYDMLYGKKYIYGQSNPFSKTVLALGLRTITVSEVKKISPEGVYYVYGENFTQSSKLEVNGEVQDTTYLDNKTLLVKGITIEKGDWIDVGQQSNSSTHKILSRSNTYVYGAGNLTDMTSEDLEKLKEEADAEETQAEASAEDEAAEGGAAEGETAEGETAEGETAGVETAEGETADGETTEGEAAA